MTGILAALYLNLKQVWHRPQIYRTESMNEQDLLLKLKNQPESVEFSEVMAVIDSHYEFTEGSFTNGSLQNNSGENNGSHKLFAFAKRHDLSQSQTLACFGDYYKVDVLENPNSDNHQNIRNFMNTGWEGIQLPGNSLAPKDV